jgi:zinc transport system substrate-binding protein
LKAVISVCTETLLRDFLKGFLTVKRIAILLTLSLLIFPAFAQNKVHVSSYRLATTTSWLEVCLHDFLGEDTEVLRISPPGTCPGHFDIQPSTFTALQECDLLFYFDFQESIRETLAANSGERLQTISIVSPSGMSVPAQYVDACKSIHEALCEHFPEKTRLFEERLAAIELRMKNLSDKIEHELGKSDFSRKSVIASSHQRAFAKWLGFEVVDVFSGGDSASPRRIRGLVKTAKKENVRFVIGNLQEGTRYASLLAEEIGVPLIIFSNFPAMDGEQNSFDSLALYNLKQLMKNSEK